MRDEDTAAGKSSKRTARSCALYEHAVVTRERAFSLGKVAQEQARRSLNGARRSEEMFERVLKKQAPRP